MSNAPSGLEAPSLTLYAFHLRNDFSQGADRVVADAERLWLQLTQLGQRWSVPELKALPKHLVDYHNGDYQPDLQNQLQQGKFTLLKDGSDGLEFHLMSQPDGIPLEGSLSPFRLHDTYGIDLTLLPKQTIALSQLGQLNPQSGLCPPTIQASLGQTLLLYAKPETRQSDYTDLVNQIVAELLQGAGWPTTQPRFVAQGRLLDDPIFELDNGETDPALQCHILVWLNCCDLLPESINQVTEPLIYLLWCRHKICYAYHQSRESDRQGKTLYSLLEGYVTEFQQSALRGDRLLHFQKLLAHLPQQAFTYTCHLRDLSDHEATIITNATNYERNLKRLEPLFGQDSTCLRHFLIRVHERLEVQIQTDQRYLLPGKDLAQQLIETVQTMVEIEQAEGDRRLEQTIQVLGIGLATGSIVGSASSYMEKPIKPPFSTNTIHPLVTTLFWSFLAAIVAGGITWFLTQSHPKSRKH